jgi:GNAT superfamily N-acetyltransferase
VTAGDVSIIAFAEQHRDACAGILRRLPEWFGIESANQAYIAALGRLPTFIAVLDGTPVGFIALEDHLAGAAEIHVLAVAPDLHRHGIGTALMRHAERSLRTRGRTIVHVKTLGPSHPDPGYARTRAFYAARGYQPLFESTAFWGKDQPTLILIKLL